jgi:[acyl-carrier-protein] S-malonyltransferase
MVILGCPGQGSQSKGFLEPFLSEVPGFASKLEELSIASSRDLIRLGTTAEEDEIKDTANAQPLIVGASIATVRTLLVDQGISGVIGHSVGEFAAAAIAEVITDTEAMHLVTVRAQAMAEAATLEKTSMAAILGGEMSDILASLDNLGLSIANYNGAGQVVAAGSVQAIAKLIETPPTKARVIELKVAGAFHTSYMAPASSRLQAAADLITPKDPSLKLWSNCDGSSVTSGKAFLQSLVDQVSKPVRWDLCMESIAGEELEFVELPPAGALAGLVKRGVQGSRTIAIKLPEDTQKIGA